MKDDVTNDLVLGDVHLDHVEFYVNDLPEQQARWRDVYGFRIIGERSDGQDARRSVMLAQGDIRLVLTRPMSADDPAATYLAEHGDGVATIAFRTGDLKSTLERAINGGAAVLAPRVEHADGEVQESAVVSGFGDVIHPLLQRRGAGPGLPAGFTAVQDSRPGPSIREAGEPEVDLLTLDHFAVCLRAGELTPVASYYERAFGFSDIFEERIVVGNQAMMSRVVRSASGTVTLTIIEPDPSAEPGQIDQFLASQGGAGVQHMAFATNDIVRSVDVLSRRGVDFLSTPDTYYDNLGKRLTVTKYSLESVKQGGILVDEDHGGQLFQVFAASTTERRTIFFELIERIGAQTFGSANIKALYEAVEMERQASSVSR